MKGKSILINACMIAYQPSGVGVYSIELLKELVLKLKREEYDFTIYCYNPNLLHAFESNKVKKISLGYLLDKLLKSKEVIHRHIWNIFFLNFIAAKFDILYSFSSHGALYHQNQIITIHDLICLNFPDTHKSQYYYFKYFLPFVIKQSKQIIAISQFTKNDVLKHYSLNSNKVSVIYNGINHIESFSDLEKNRKWLSTITDQDKFCLMVGASYPHKNFETLLRVCERMKNTNVKFIITSKPNLYFQTLQEKVKNLQLNNVIFLHYIDRSQLLLLYKMARLNIYVSLYEGFGFPPAEACYFGTQSLLSNTSALTEVYKENFEITDPFNVNRIEEIVKKYTLAENKIETNFYSTLKQKYNWERTAAETIKIFKDIN